MSRSVWLTRAGTALLMTVSAGVWATPALAASTGTARVVSATRIEFEAAARPLLDRTVDLTAPSLEAQWQRYRDWFAPVHVAWQHLDDAGRRALEADFADLWGSSTRGGGPGIVVPNTYLQTTAVRAG